VKSISEQIPAAETERMMKIQDVILKAMAGKLKWGEAAEIMPSWWRLKTPSR
jgi:hypothetical protein